MSKEVYEGFFMIPYQGQMRFRVDVYDGELVFSGGKPEHDTYFQEKNYVTTYRYDDQQDDHHEKQREKRRGFLHNQAEDIKEFIMGSEPMMETEPLFEGTIFGKEFSANGKLIVRRLYE